MKDEEQVGDTTAPRCSTLILVAGWPHKGGEEFKTTGKQGGAEKQSEDTSNQNPHQAFNHRVLASETSLAFGNWTR